MVQPYSATRLSTFVSRCAELATKIFFYFYEKVNEDNNSVEICGSEILCFLLQDLVEYSYMLAYLFNILLYNNFNSNFRKGLRNFLGLKQIKSSA